MALSILINGIERVGYYVPGSLSVPSKIEERSTADFDMVVADGSSYKPNPLEPISIWNGDSQVFGGFVWSIDEQLVVDDANRTERQLSVSCVDNHLLADRRLVAETYDNQNAGGMASDMTTKYLANDGVSIGFVLGGPTVIRAVFNYVTVADAMHDLAELAGFYWRINYRKELIFASRFDYTAPWRLDAQAKVRGVKVRRTPDTYRNREYVRAGHDMTPVRTETFKGDGENKTFTLAYPVAKVPTITVNTLPQTVGIKGVDQDKDFYWNKGENVITQDDNGFTLIDTQTLSVQYQGLYPIMVVSEAGSEVNTYGAFEAVDDAASIDSVDSAREFAGAKLRRYGRISGELEFETEQPGLYPGMLLSVDLPNLGLSGAWLIQEVTFSDFGSPDESTFRYQVKALDGESIGGWEAFFRKLTQQGTGYAIRDNEVLVKLRTHYDTAVITETLTRTAAAPESRVDYARVGVGLSEVV